MNMHTFVTAFAIGVGFFSFIRSAYCAWKASQSPAGLEKLNYKFNFQVSVIVTVGAALTALFLVASSQAEHKTTTTISVVSTTSSGEVILNDMMSVAFIEDPTVLDKYITSDIKEVNFGIRPAYDLESDLYHQFLSRLEKLAEEHPNLDIRYQAYDESYVSYQEVKRLSEILKSNMGFDSKAMAEEVMEDVLKNVNNIVLNK